MIFWGDYFFENGYTFVSCTTYRRDHYFLFFKISELKVARITRLVHPRWEKRTLPTSMFCRLSHVRYQCAALNRCPLRTRLAYFGKHISVKCRYGCAADEDLKHVLFHCPTIRKERKQVFEVCKEYGYKKTFKNLLTRKRLQMPMEKLIMKFTESKTA